MKAANACTTNQVVTSTALPGGYRNNNGTFNNIGNNGNWWSSTEYSTTNACLNRSVSTKSYGFSVRCVRDLKGTCPCSPSY
ncbi:MAG: hypothetical protein NTY32_10035 [Bacteroidia bacterium]|nr:hypothetical protein [Bacteroidia bacterium]